MWSSQNIFSQSENRENESQLIDREHQPNNNNSRISRTEKSKSRGHKEEPNYARDTQNSLKRKKTKNKQISFGSRSTYKFFGNPQLPQKKVEIGFSNPSMTFLESQIQFPSQPTQPEEARTNILRIDNANWRFNLNQNNNRNEESSVENANAEENTNENNSQNQKSKKNSKSKSSFFFKLCVVSK